MHELKPNISETCAALLRAAGVPPTYQGAAKITPKLLTCIGAAANTWTDAPIKEWKDEIEIFAKWHRQLSSSNPAAVVQYVLAPPENCHFFHAFSRWQPSISKIGPMTEIDALLGRALVVSAQTKSGVNMDLIMGLNTLKVARQDKRSRSKDWGLLLGLNLTNLTDLTKANETLGQQSRCHGFLTAALSVLRETIFEPRKQLINLNDEPTLGDHASDFDSPDSLKTGSTSISGEKNQLVPGPSNETGSYDAIADVTSRLAAADYSSVPEKLGIYHRDQLLIEDLSIITHRLRNVLRAGNRIEQGFSIVGIIGLVTSTSDIFTLNLPLKPNGNIWLDLEHLAWAWDFSKYRDYQKPENKCGCEPILIPLPLEVAELLFQLQANNQNFLKLGELVALAQGCKNFDLKAYRSFLRNLGNTAHPAHRGRFSRSMLGACLEITGSDMTATLMTARFTPAAPAALYYFGPTYKTIYEHTAKVYDRLGLGPHSIPVEKSERAGCKKIIEPESLEKYWSCFVTQIDASRENALRSRDHAERCQLATKWMVNLCTALVIQSAHRGTRFDCLTFSSLFGADEMGVIHDKDDTVGDRSQPRLIPWTSKLRSILDGAIECHQLMRSDRIDINKSSPFKGDDPVFVSWVYSKEVLTIIQVEPKAVAEVIRTHFNEADINFGRSNWVTALDEAGIDRWLIRSLTGHTRDVTRTNGAYFDIPPRIAAQRLGEAMELVGKLWFGITLPKGKAAPFFITTKNLTTQPFSEKKLFNSRIPDPRTILEPIDAAVLVGWSHASRIREGITSGKIDGSPAALSVLHLLFIDLLPNPLLALATGIDLEKRKQHGFSSMLVEWERPHFVHPTRLPLTSMTKKMLQQIGPTDLKVDTLISEVCTSINEWVKKTFKDTNLFFSFLQLAKVAQDFRRLEFPPSLLAVSSDNVPAPCLSLNSLLRLAGQIPDQQSKKVERKIPWSYERTSREKDISELAKKINKYADQTSRLGESRKRAVDCLHEIENLSCEWTFFGWWLRKWVIEEFDRLRLNLPNCYQISSISTYLGTLSLQSKQLECLGDPFEWDDDDWSIFLDQTDLFCRDSTRSEPSSNQPVESLHPRASHAIKALTRSLKRRGFMIPEKILKRLNIDTDILKAYDSASSVIVTQENTVTALSITNQWLADRPLERLLAEIRFSKSELLPMRSGDISSLSTDCITPGGGFIIERMGYNLHKTKDTIRVASISTEAAERIRFFNHQLLEIRGHQPLMMRGDGSRKEGLQDQKVAFLCGEALKISTADPKARMHSKRGASLQEFAWPGWQGISRDLLNNRLSISTVCAWTQKLSLNWTGLSNATVLAGHADLRSALGNYLAGWPLVHAAFSLSLLSQLTPSSQYLKKLGLNPDNFRKSKSRKRLHTEADHNKDCSSFNSWDWIQSQSSTSIKVLPILQSVNVKENERVPTTFEKNTSERTNDPLYVTVLYFTLRALGISQSSSIHKSRISLTGAISVDLLLPKSQEISHLTRRARQAVQPRGVVANSELALSNKGNSIFSWLLGLEPTTLEFLCLAFNRDWPVPIGYFDNNEQWKSACKNIPSFLTLQIQKGSSHVSVDEAATALNFSPHFQLKLDPKIGIRPRVSLLVRGKDNRVESARSTSVAGVAILAIHSILKSMDESS